MNRPALWGVLQHIGVSEKIRRLIKDIHTEESCLDGLLRFLRAAFLSSFLPFWDCLGNEFGSEVCSEVFELFSFLESLSTQ